VPDTMRVGEVGAGWKVAGATLSGERQMVSGAGSGGVDRIGGRGVDNLLALAQSTGCASNAVLRQDLMRVYSEERIRDWTNQRVRAGAKAGRAPGPESSVGKVHAGGLNQRIQLLATAMLGAGGAAWEGEQPYEVRGMLRSRANTIEGGTTEVNKNILGERVLGLPREPDPYQGAPWRDIPRS
jgi:alkylation response protein AidB-like acyl-CoA dehydrogenase